MSVLIGLDSVSYRAGPKQLFQDVKLTIASRARLGIVGPNGSGKSTLMKIIAGLVPADEGRVVLSRNARAVYVPQLDSFEATDSIEAAILKNLGLHLEEHDGSFDSIAVRAVTALSRVGFSDFKQTVSTLSGGWRKRLALAAALAAEPDVLLLDEPTNHLDLAGLFWLEDLLLNAQFAWALISHDRYFLERTVTNVLEIAPSYPTGVFRAEGSYLTFTQKREQYLAQQAQQAASLVNKVRTELDWAARSPKARTGKAAYRLKEAARLHNNLKELQSRTRIQDIALSFTDAGRQTRELVKLIEVSKAFEEKQLLKKVNFTVTNGMCLGVLGGNGQGKSTLLKLIGGELRPSSGKVKQAAFLRVAYFDQLRHSLNGAQRLREALGDGGDQVVYRGKPVHIIGWARRFGFVPNELDRPVAELSGGQQARVLLAKLVRQEADLLILDEPTNDLDIPMLEALESMLLEFDGAVVLVTHDRFMLEEVCTHFLGFNREQDLLPYGSYDQWEAAQPHDAVNNETVRVSKAENVRNSSSKTKATKLSYNDQREYDQIESMILKAEKRFAELEVQASNSETHSDYAVSARVATELAEAKAKVEELYQRWEELDTLKNELKKGA